MIKRQPGYSAISGTNLEALREDTLQIGEHCSLGDHHPSGQQGAPRGVLDIGHLRGA